MSSEKNFTFIYIATVICIIISGGCLKIANDVYLDTDNDFTYFVDYGGETFSRYDVRNWANEEGMSVKSYLQEYGLKVLRDRDLSVSYVILYISAIVFSISLCCITYLCTKI